MTTPTTDTATTRDVVLAMYAAGFETATTGDVEPFLAFYHEDCVIHEPAWLPYGGPNHGHDGIRTIMAGVGQFMDLTTAEVDAMVIEDDKAVVLFRSKLHNGAEVYNAEHWTVRDGKVTEGAIFYQDPTPVQEFLAATS